MARAKMVNLACFPTAKEKSMTQAAGTPEASTTVSFCLLLTLGLGDMVIAAKRRKAA